MDAAPDDLTPPAAASLRCTVPAVPAELGGLRSRVVAFVTAGGADDEAVAAIELAVSELVTNVIQHTDADQVTIDVGSTDGGWRLDVSDADRLPAVTARSAPDATRLSGRGLFLVQQVMDSVDLVDLDGGRYVRCYKRT